MEFSDLQKLTPEQIDNLRRRSSVLIRNVVDDAQANAWRDELKAFVKENPVEGAQ